MAGKKIKGITIQFGADASALDKALKDVNNTSAGLNKELKEVNRLLKFDPKSITLLAQKQEILANSIENTEKKLDALKQAQSEVEKLFKSGEIGAEEYREFQRTLEETEQSLASYRRQQENLVKEQKNLRESTKQLNTFLEATGKSLDEFQDVLGTRLTNSLKTGVANSDDLTIALNKIGKAALGADTDLEKMRAALNRIDEGGIDEVRRALGELQTEAGTTEDALNEVGKGVAAGNLLDAADQFSALGDKVIEVGQKALETSQELENAAAKTSAYFGETGKAAQDNAELIREIYEKGIGESMDAVSEAVITVRKNLQDLNEADLSNISQQAITLDELYGIDMNESMRGVNALMEHFGLDAVVAMDLLVAGTQNGLDKTNELGDNLAEYSGKFAEAGYSAEEYFQLLNNGLDNGAYNLDKVNDAINEVTTRLADGTIADSMSKIDEKTGELLEGTGGWSQSVEDVFRKWQDGGATQKQVIDAIVQDIQNTENQQDKLNKAALAFGTMAEDGSMKFISALTSVGSSYDDVSGKAAEMQENTTTSAREMEGAVRKVEDALAPIGEDIQSVFAPLLEFLAELAAMFSELPEPVRNFIEIFGGIAALAAVIVPVIGAVVALNGALVSLVGIGLAPVIGIVAAVAAAIAGIIVVIKNWGAITDWLSEKWQAFKEWFAGLWDGISETVQTVWTGIKDFLSAIWQQIYSVIEVPLNLIKGIIEGVMYAIYAVIYTVWEVIKAAIGAAWDWITDKASAIFEPLAEFFSGIWNGIKDTVSSVWNSTTSTLGGIWDKIYSNAKSAFSKVWDYIKKGFTTLRDTIGGIVKGIANAIISPIEGAVNGVIKGVNWILDAVGSDKQFSLWQAPHFAKGTGGIPRDTFGIVNDQKGSVYREMIVPPDGDPFIPEGRNIMLPLKKGTKIMPAGQTKSFLDSLPHFASGIGEFFGGIWNTVKDFTGTVWDYITHPEKIVQIAIDKFTDLAGVVEPWLSVAKGAVNTVFDGVVGFIKDIFDTQTTVNYNPSAGVEQWRTLAERALRMTGQYNAGNLNLLLYQMQTESGGNPNAINNWDINAVNGTPSKGLMQVIDPTFQAYKYPGYDNIWDPLSNMLAAIRYTVSRYGSLANGWHGHGYAQGIGEINLASLFSIPMLDVSWFKEGGILTKPAAFSLGSGRVGVAGEGGEAEAITPISKLKDYVRDAVADVVGDKNIQITINITQQIDKRKLAKELIPVTVPLTNEYNTQKKRQGGVRSNGTAKSYI